MNYNAVIVDDERLARVTLKKDLERFPEVTIVGEASSVKEAKKVIERTGPDLLFLDIQLTDGNGFDLLNQIEFSGKIVFVTAYDEYALRAFEVNALDYLMKPVSPRRLKNAIERLSGDMVEQADADLVKLNYNDRLMVMHRRSVNFIRIDSISSILASREYSYIITSNGKEYLTSKNISQWEKRLPEQNFCRIHRSTIINFDNIIKIDHDAGGTGEVRMQGVTEPLGISRMYFRKLKERYGL